MEHAIRHRVPVSGGSWVTVDVFGEPGAPGLLVLPGVMSDAHGWRDVVRALSAWPSAAVVNRRGRTPSGPLTGDYSMRTEVADLGAVLDALGEPRAVFGWSYGALVALLAAGERPVRQLIGYEPVLRPFGAEALEELKAADAAADLDLAVEIVNRRISGFSAEYVEALRADRPTWEMLRRLAEPLYAEIAALNSAEPRPLGRLAERVDLVVGARNRGLPPYGTAFEDVRALVPGAAVHVLPGQGHLAHAEGPAELAALLDTLAG
ncbi:alpha/beta fold hydrolase [Streptomyces sp. NRRL F-5123]|uniref:alpha/beta fold hydrolase n=1 Tax=Streptomyces sp. NRRL F-5123 TaxID=1463856 RepID=UPI0004E0DAC6|nr:alpha/beta hydrolase [Streptomyces sp. NRRL F-5123]